MTFTPLTRILPIALSLLLSASVQAQTEDAAATVRKQLRIDTYKNVTYFDDKKNVITAEQFDERIKAGAYASMEKQKIGDAEPVVKLTAETKPRLASKPSFKIKPGDAFPEFSLEMLNNKSLENKALMGRYTVVSFYFAGCAPCIDEIPELNALAEGREDMNFIGITFDPIKVTRKFVEEHKLTWTLLPDAKPFLKTIGVNFYPTLALLDPTGKLVAIEPGYAIKKSDKTIAAWAARLMAASK